MQVGDKRKRRLNGLLHVGPPKSAYDPRVDSLRKRGMVTSHAGIRSEVPLVAGTIRIGAYCAYSELCNGPRAKSI